MLVIEKINLFVKNLKSRKKIIIGIRVFRSITIKSYRRISNLSIVIFKYEWEWFLDVILDLEIGTLMYLHVNLE